LDFKKELDIATWADDEQEAGGTTDHSKRNILALPSDDLLVGGVGLHEDVRSQNTMATTSEECSESPGPCVLAVREMTEEDVREETARVALRTKFDHDPYVQNTSTNRDIRAISKSRGLTSSPPPPVLINSATDAPQNPAFATHGHVRQKKQQTRLERNSPPSNSTTVARCPSPILFTHGVVADGASSPVTMSSSPQNTGNASSNLFAYGSQALDAAATGTINDFGSHSHTGSVADGGDLEVGYFDVNGAFRFVNFIAQLASLRYCLRVILDGRRHQILI
jgi:hypothetical protein